MLAESYRVLQVPFGAEMPQIRQAYRRLVLQYHPDRNQQPGAHDMFLRVQAAYEYLQRFQELGIAPAAPTPFTAPAPLTPEEEFQKYQYVYEPPLDPEAHAAWTRVAKERVRRQKEKDEAEFVRRTLEFKTKWWYEPARVSSYLIMVLGCLVGLFSIIFPLSFLFTDNLEPVTLAIVLIPMGWKILDVMRSLRDDIRKHFGEDLPPPNE